MNLVSRIEAVGKALKVPIIVNDDFARAYGKPLHPLGRHVLRRNSLHPTNYMHRFCHRPLAAHSQNQNRKARTFNV